ncbi:1-phosphofructokinase family hexose kinase [Mycobacterium sp. NAZ190054]|uniref:1-phosphofructokinase family hexose kinase n=1 Tax=Mycobacterium sp. NAZ190054 TaxID=1747766 RepID=UPI0007956CEB|nr:1-phosphofructokinase family hexose kinase [Mycobacterium sp. NAZ190054]KWX56546.1 phosphofructokinase [Mycobacterium sp. NAZ190054]
MIVTLTPNPALDVAAVADEVQAFHKIRCRSERSDAGGGGVNVARFVHALGVPVTAVLTAGGTTGVRVVELLDAAGVPATIVPIDGTTRESFTIDDAATGRQFRFVLPGPRITRSEQEQCLDALREVAVSAQYVVASGSLPPGVPPDFCQRVADVCEQLGVRLILDTSGSGLSHVSSGVFLLKPSLRELRDCMRRPLETEAEQLAAAHELIDHGVAESVVVSCGARGALLAGPGISESFAAPAVRSVNGVGAGDAMVAGIVVGLARGARLREAVGYGVAAAAAKLHTPGTSAFDRADVDQFFHARSYSSVCLPGAWSGDRMIR